MGITNANKTVDTREINCDGTFQVTLALAATPNITENPTDIVLVLDRSGSMAGIPLASMKQGAKTFIDIIEEATDGVKDGVIGGGSHIGIVSFADTAMANTQLITSVANLKNAVDALTAGGDTNHAAAFTKAVELFDATSTNAKVIVIFTDGKTTAGAPPAPIAAAARGAGIIIYAIGLVGDDGIDVDALNDWASDPDSSHVAITPNAEELEELFADLAKNISKPGATNIIIDETVFPEFDIISVSQPTKGTAKMVDAHTIQWKIPELGVTGNEGAVLRFCVRHTGQTSGDLRINRSITYSDNEGNVVNFPNPTINVDCGVIVRPEPCPVPTNFTVGGCNDTMVVDLDDTFLESQGRIIELNATIKHVCPGKRVALGVVLTEVDDEGLEHQRGMKALTIPAHHFPTCRDVQVNCIKFVLPEDLAESEEFPRSMCGTRNLRVRLIAHNIDTDFRCCGDIDDDDDDE